jgi:cytochrome P450
MPTADPVFDPRLPEFHANPYPFYHALREKDPVHQSPMGFWVLTRYDDVVTSLRDPRYGRDGFAPLLKANYELEGSEDDFPRSMLWRDPPDHTRLRALVNKAFTPRVIEGMRTRIQTIVDGLLDKVQGARSMDVIDDLAYPLPARASPPDGKAQGRSGAHRVRHRGALAIRQPGPADGTDHQC